MKYSDVKITLVSVLVFRLGSSRSTSYFYVRGVSKDMKVNRSLD